jgi:hypothetical protein
MKQRRKPRAKRQLEAPKLSDTGSLGIDQVCSPCPDSPFADGTQITSGAPATVQECLLGFTPLRRPSLLRTPSPTLRQALTPDRPSCNRRPVRLADRRRSAGQFNLKLPMAESG